MSQADRKGVTDTPASEPGLAVEMWIGWFRGRAISLLRSEFGRNAAWFTLLSGVERCIAVVQTILISRALGIAEYGAYGLLFGTIGFVASVAGLQMGLTATVFISKYRVSEKARVAAVISTVQRFGWIVGLVFVVATVPFGERISRFLLGSGTYEVPLVLGSLFVAASIASGVQDGIAQGFEIFGVLAKLKIALSVLVVACVYPAATEFGLSGVLIATLLGLLVKLCVLSRAVAVCRTECQIPSTGSGVSFGSLASNFAIPSMAVSLGLGFLTWFGMYWLSRQPAGFESVAIVSTGLQWRNPILLISASLGTVAVPAFSRLDGAGDGEAARRLFRLTSAATFGLGALAVASIAVLSGTILDFYGQGFRAGWMSFVVLVISTLPTAMAGVHLQKLVASGRMWRQLWLYLPSLAVLALGYATLIPSYRALGYSLSTLAASSVLFATLIHAGRFKTLPAVRPISNNSSPTAGQAVRGSSGRHAGGSSGTG
jgi:O-antigen/teichoic acid export membrane protein